MLWDAIMGAAGSGISSGISSAFSSAIGGLFGGSKGPSAGRQLALQDAYQRKLAENLPWYQVEGLRKAGLNPMLAATKGMPGAAPPQMGTQDDRAIANQATSARAAQSQADTSAYVGRRQVELNAQLTEADIEVKEATRDFIQAQTLSEINRPENIASGTALNRAHIPNLDSSTQVNLATLPKIKQETETSSAHADLLNQQAKTEVQRRGLVMAETSLTKAMERLNVTKETQERVLTAIKDMDFHVARQAAQEAANKSQISPTTLGKILSSINLWAKAIQGK